MAQEKTSLEVGDIVYEVGYRSYNVRGRYKIDRVTNTQAISGNTRFKRDCKEGRISVIGDSGYSSSFFRLWSEELEKKYIAFQLAQKIGSIKFTELPFETMQRIMEIVEPDFQPTKL